jgi:dimethylhistidine N-methyltransferase
MALQQNRELKEFARDVANGLSSKSKTLNSKYLYDEIGSQLFEQICVQPEYYLTRVETSILNRHAVSIAALTDCNISLIEFGSGSSTKTNILLNHLVSQKKKISYFPVDISRAILIESVRRLRSQFPNVNVIGIPSDYNIGLEIAAKYIAGSNEISDQKLVVFMGSSIGNFEYAEARAFLKKLRESLNICDFLLVGFDLQKDKTILDAAYNDKAGITAKFNLNLLARINRELDGKFDLRQFGHYAFYNDKKQRVEMHIISKSEQQVCIGALGKTFTFRKGETIHTENSYKYNLDEIAMLAQNSSFAINENFMDKNKWFDLAFFSPS